MSLLLAIFLFSLCTLVWNLASVRQSRQMFRIESPLLIFTFREGSLWELVIVISLARVVYNSPDEHCPKMLSVNMQERNTMI